MIWQHGTEKFHSMMWKIFTYWSWYDKLCSQFSFMVGEDNRIKQKILHFWQLYFTNLKLVWICFTKIEDHFSNVNIQNAGLESYDIILIVTSTDMNYQFVLNLATQFPLKYFITFYSTFLIWKVSVSYTVVHN